MAHYLLHIILFSLICSTVQAMCNQEVNCFSPQCYCSGKFFPKMNVTDIPQMVYFGFDDAVTSTVQKCYDDIFIDNHNNPNNCPIKMSLYVSNDYTDYKLVKKYYNYGHEIGVHSVKHGVVNTSKLLIEEARTQKENLVHNAAIDPKDIIGWRSPFLIPAGNEQPEILKKLGFKYDITLTYYVNIAHNFVWPSTLDYPWPYRCNVGKCSNAVVKGFWEVPIIPLVGPKLYPCTYVDGCVFPPTNEKETFDYLWNNFIAYYNSSRAPFGLNMHAAWFTGSNSYRISAVNTFLKKILALGDVYVVSVKEILEWMKNPTPLSNIKEFQPWSCDDKNKKKIKTHSRK